MDRLAYDGPSDLRAVAAANPYVPEDLKGKVFIAYRAKQVLGANLLLRTSSDRP
jgi:hypothetical protein